MPESEKIADLWRLFKTQPSDELLAELVNHYLPYVQSLARQRAAKLPKSVELDDLISWGVIGLLDAIDAYQPDRQVSFTAFSHRRIVGAIIDELRALDWLPRQVRARAKTVENARAQLTNELSAPPSDEQLAQRAGLKSSEYASLLRHLRAADARSLHRPATSSNSPDDPRALLPCDDRAGDPSRAAQKNSLKEIIVKGLTTQERLIVVLYYYEGLNMREIGAVLDVCESRVSQMHKSILKRLKSRMLAAPQMSDQLAAEGD